MEFDTKHVCNVTYSNRTDIFKNCSTLISTRKRSILRLTFYDCILVQTTPTVHVFMIYICLNWWFPTPIPTSL